MQTTSKSPEKVQKELKAAGVEFQVFPAPTSTRPTTIEFRFVPQKFQEQQEALDKLGYAYMPAGGTIACEPEQEAPSLKENYAKMSPEEQEAVRKSWVRMGGALEE